MCARRRGESPPSCAALVELEQMSERLDRRVERLQLLRLELPQARGQPGGALGLDRAQHLVARRRKREPDPTLVAFDRSPLDEAGLLQFGDELGHAWDGHPLDRSQLAHADSGPQLDLDEQADMASGDAERVDFPPELAV